MADGSQSGSAGPSTGAGSTVLSGSVTHTVVMPAAAIEQDFSSEPVGSCVEPCPNQPVGEPGFWEGMIPIWGSGRSAVNDFQNGRWGWGLVNGALAVTDVFLVKALVVGVGKALVKGVAKEAIEQGGKQVLKEGAEQAVKEGAEQTAKEGVEQAAKKSVKEIPKTYERPSGFRKGVREQAWENAKGADGKVRDPVTGKEMKFEDPWDMGHKPGHEFRKHQQSAMERKIDRKQFLDEHNNPEHYRPELPSSNRSHKGELKTDEYFGD